MPGGKGKLKFSYEKICQDVAGLAVVGFVPIWVMLLERFSPRPSVGIPAFLILEFLVGVAVFELTYRGLWRSVDSKLKGRLPHSSSDQPQEDPWIRSYSELIYWWRSQRDAGDRRDVF